MRYIIAYDIENDKTRNKVAKLLEGYGARLQKSVFECDLNKRKLAVLRAELTELTDARKDSVLIIPNCQACIAKRELIGATYTERIINVIEI